MQELIKQYMIHIIWSVPIIILLVYMIIKFLRVSGVDKNYKEYYENGQLKKQGNPRNIWDYSIFPGISRLWFKEAGMPAALSLLVLFVFCFLFLVTRNRDVLFLLGVNLGVFLGMMLMKK